jgi:hypothetical protein
MIYHQAARKKGHTNDPKRTPWQVDVHTGEGADTSVLQVENVVAAFERIAFPVKVECKFGKIGDALARNSVLAIP